MSADEVGMYKQKITIHDLKTHIRNVQKTLSGKRGQAAWLEERDQGILPEKRMDTIHLEWTVVQR